MKSLILLRSIIINDFRDKGKIFFSIVFPVLFMIIFGFVFGGESSNVLAIGYYGINDPLLYQTIDDLHYKLIRYKTNSEMQKAIKKQKVDFGITRAKNEIDGILNEADIQNYSTYQNAFNLIIKNYAVRKSGAKIYFKTKDINISNIKTSHGLGYIIPGIIGFSIMSSAMFSAIEIISEYKKKDILKRFAVTPIKSLKFLFSAFLSKLILSFISAYIVFLIAIIIFGTRFSINYIVLTITIVTSSILMFMSGAAITILFKKPETANNVASMLFTIMMFFSGVYFPISFLPKYLQLFGKILPGTYVVQFMRYSFGVETLHISNILIFNISVVIISVILLPLISKGLFVIKEE